MDGTRVRYDEIWQHRNLVLVLADAPQRDAATLYASQLKARGAEFEEAETTVIVTTDAMHGLSAPKVVIADRWGEILHSEAPVAGDVSRLPSVDELLSWVRFARIQCPECPP